jgi:hypothetical protein
MSSVPFRISLAEVQPSQLYINRAKLTPLLAAVRINGLHALAPVPLKVLNGWIIYTDGHSHALAVWLNGYTEIEAVWENDPLDWDANQICVDWCLAASIHTVANLTARILEPEAYSRLWLEPCRRMQTQLASQKD